MSTANTSNKILDERFAPLLRLAVGLCCVFLANWCAAAVLRYWSFYNAAGRDARVVPAVLQTFNPWAAWDHNQLTMMMPIALAIIVCICLFLPRKMLFIGLAVAVLFFAAFAFGHDVGMYNVPKGMRYMIITFSRLILVSLSSVGISLLWLARLDQYVGKNDRPYSRKGSSVVHGFTLIEVLVVTCIIGVMASLGFSLLASAKERANRTVDASNMHQVYSALVMYENDNDEAMPRSLAQIVPTYAPRSILCSPSDSRQGFASYPADLFLELPGEHSERVSYRISYAYLRSFEHRFQAGYTWEYFRSKPEAGILACTTHMRLDDPGDTQGISDQGPPISCGPLLRIRMDGSYYVTEARHWGVGHGGAFGEMFLYDH